MRKQKNLRCTLETDGWRHGAHTEVAIGQSMLVESGLERPQVLPSFSNIQRSLALPFNSLESGRVTSLGGVLRLQRLVQ